MLARTLFLGFIPRSVEIKKNFVENHLAAASM
jgi:hypothetical protein